MQTTGIIGCCSGRNFYNLGGAHGHFTAANQDDFNRQLFRLGHSTINIAITNETQAKTREYMAAIGWKHQQVTSRLWCSTISAADFSKARNEWTAKQTTKKQETAKTKLHGPRIFREPLATMADLHLIARRVHPVRGGVINNWADVANTFANNPQEFTQFLNEVGRHYNIQMPSRQYVSTRWWNWYSLLNSVVNRVRAARLANGR